MVCKKQKTAETLLEKGLMTELGIKATETSKENGMWDARTAESEHAMIEAFKEKLSAYPLKYEKFMQLPTSTQLAETKRYNLYKTEERREITFK